MQEAFGTIIFVVVILAFVAAVLSFAMSRRAYDEIGRGGLDSRDDMRAKPKVPTGTDAERDDEIRQMLTARNARRAARGEATVDVEDELRQLTRPAPAGADPELVEEIRVLVERRNRRREAKGQEPLDVEAEIQRRLSELGG